jgi:hypothetical protein
VKEKSMAGFFRATAGKYFKKPISTLHEAFIDCFLNKILEEKRKSSSV